MSNSDLLLALQVSGPAHSQVIDEIINAAPVDIDVGNLKIALEVSASARGLYDLAALGIDLHRHVGKWREGFLALFAHDRAEEDSEVPVVKLEAEKDESRIGEVPTYFRGDEFSGRALRHANQVIEVVVLCDHQGVGLHDIAEKLEHER